MASDGGQGRGSIDGAALIVVDMQRYFCEPDWALGRNLVAAGVPGVSEYYERLTELVVPNIHRLIAAWRAAQAPIIYTEFGSRSADGEDLPLWARRHNEMTFRARGERIYPPLSDDSARVIPELAPSTHDLVVTKTTSGPLAGTDIHVQLRDRFDVSFVVVTGVATDACVMGFGRELADAGFDVVVVGDACAAPITAHHDPALRILATFASVRDTAEVLGSAPRSLQPTT